MNGIDTSNCGHRIPCRTIGFALSRRHLANNCIIRIQNSTLSQPFIINSSFPILRNLTLEGIGGRPTISAQNPLQPLYVFQVSETQKVKIITIRVKNLIFSGIGIVHLINMTLSNSISIENCHFENISTDRDIIRIDNHPHTSQGGSIHFRNCNFTNNHALRSIWTNQSDNIFQKCNFENNLSTGSSLIFLLGRFTSFRNSHFEKNTQWAKDVINIMGGTVYAANNATVEISHCSFRRNKAKNHGGAIFAIGKKLLIRSSLFEYNAAVPKFSGRSYGGAIFANVSVIEILSSSFTGNKVLYGGGAIYMLGKKLLIKSSLFKYNAAMGRQRSTIYGGAVYAHSTSSFEIFNCSFTRNKETYLGGAIYSLGKKLVINSSSFKRNEATKFGGAIYAFVEMLVTKSTIYEYNTVVGKHFSESYGGAIYAKSVPSFEIFNCLFIGNKARVGGAILSYGKKLIINLSLFERNKAIAFGGAIFAYVEILVTKSSIYEYNTAVSKHISTTGGGAVTAFSASSFEISNCSFIRNKAKGFGGAILFKGKKLLINSSLLKSNEAAEYGGAIYAIVEILVTKSSTYEYNTAVSKNIYKQYGGGGGVYANASSSFKIFSCSFIKNKADDGGAILSDGKQLVINSSLFTTNEATAAGGAIYAIVEILVTKSSIYEYNTAGSKSIIIPAGGGAVYASFALRPNHSVEVLNCSFLNNSATFAGGGIYVIGGMFFTKSSLYDSNTALGKNNTESMGGAVLTVISSEVVFLNCVLKGNRATKGGAVSSSESFDEQQVTFWRLGLDKFDKISKIGVTEDKLNRLTEFKNITGKLIIDSSTFKDNYALRNKFVFSPTSGGGGALYLKDSSTSSISNCSFEGNKAGDTGGAIHSEGSRLYVKVSNFCNNSVGGMGGAIFTYSLKLKGSISECFFRSNKAIVNGGAVSHVGNQLLINTSEFQNNAAVGRGGEGGALFLKAQHRFHYVNISHCKFYGNQAFLRGGTIMTATNTLHIENSSLQSSDLHSESNSHGEFFYSKSNVVLERVSLVDDNSYSPRNSLIVHQNSKMEIRKSSLVKTESTFSLKDGVYIKCLTGKNIEVSNQTFKSPNTFTFISVYCSFCVQNSYSLYSGQLNKVSQNESIEKTERKCHPCPIGAICEKGNIRAANGYWGFIVGKEVLFASCPFGYCCFKKECISYNSCHKSRTGILCGQCKKGFTENLVTQECLLPKDCSHPWYSVAVMLIGIVYVIMLICLDEVSKILKALLLPAFISNQVKNINSTTIRISKRCNHMWRFLKPKCWYKSKQGFQYLTDDILVEEAENSERLEILKIMPGDVEFICDEKIQLSLVSHKGESEENVLPGLLKIIIFFYQTNILFKTQAGLKSSGFFNSFQEAISTIFNLRTEGAFAQHISWCPLDNIRPVSKVLLKSSFIIYLFFLMLLVFTLLRIGKLSKIIKGTGLNSSRLLRSILRLVSISYAGITAACFSLLMCVELGHFGKRLFIDGSIQCYRSWQIIIICIVCCWIVPFPFTIYASSQLLHNRMLSTKQFVLCLLFPLPTIFYWLYHCHKNAKKGLDHMEILSKDVQDILQILEGPFRKKNACDKEKACRLPWESVYIGRRLVFIFIKTFVINTFLRLSLMLLCAVLFLIHHVYTKPFSSNILNSIETVSLLMLNIIGFLNLTPAYNYTYLMYSYDHTQHATQTLKVIETVLNLVFPVITGFVLAVFTCIRVIEFMLWLCCCFVRFVRSCIK